MYIVTFSSYVGSLGNGNEGVFPGWCSRFVTFPFVHELQRKEAEQCLIRVMLGSGWPQCFI